MRPHVISIGEALVEIMRPDGAHPLDKSGDFIGPFASGAPAIMAVASARLGQPTGFIGGIGEDAFGRLLRARLDSEGVDNSHIQVPSNHTTGVAFVSYRDDGSREFVFHLRHAAAGALDPNKIDSDYFSQVKWLHISGSTLALNASSREACQRALDYTRAVGGKFSFDPNLRLELMPVEESRGVFKPFIEAADVLLPTTSEAHALTGAQDDEAAARSLMAGQDKIVAFKRASAGCSIFTKEKRYDSDGFAVDQVDPTGAGDCFNAAFLFGLEATWPLAQVAEFANAAGALSVTGKAPMDSAPSRSDIDALIYSQLLDMPDKMP